MKPQARTEGRMKKVRRFFAKIGVSQHLRATSLAHQIVGKIMELSAKTRTSEETPTIVQLAHGTVDSLVSTELSRIIGKLWMDQELDVSQTMTILLGTAGQLMMRFTVFKEYPFKMCFVCKRFNPHGWMMACLAFLNEDGGDLDPGFSL